MKEKNDYEHEGNYINLRNKGLRNYSGKLLKGCVKSAATKLCIGSIPSTYESIIYNSDNKKAFGTSEKRFSTKNCLESPAPRTHHSESTKTSPSQQINVSHSRQGYGPLISKEKRQWMRLVKTPGPGAYEAPEYKKRKRIKRKIIPKEAKFHRSPSLKKEQQESIEKLQEKQQKQPKQPGPGSYQFEKSQYWKSSSQGFKSSFETKVKRDGYIPVSTTPGPGTYKTLNQKENKKLKTLSKGNQFKDNVALLDIINEEKYEEPGPGWYHHEIPTFKPIYQKIKMSHNFLSSNSHAEQENVKLPPSSTFYQIKRLYQNNNPKLINWSCFMSETKRELFGNQDSLGPNVRPLEEKYKNFHFNIKNNWL